MPKQAAKQTWAATWAPSVWLSAHQLPDALSLLSLPRTAIAHRSHYVRAPLVNHIMQVRLLALS